MALIDRNEAKERGLSGWDCFVRSQLAYKDEINRDRFVISLNIEALKLLKLSVRFGEFAQYKADLLNERRQNRLNPDFFRNHRASDIVRRSFEYMNIEFFYIATALELHFKAWLLQKNYIVNIIEQSEPFRELKDAQKSRPINKTELFDLVDYQYDTEKKRNVLKGISNESLAFKTICKKEGYIKALDISEEVKLIVDDYRNLRNQIHLPGDFCASPTISKMGEKATEVMIDFINERVVMNSNDLIRKYKSNYELLTKI